MAVEEPHTGTELQDEIAELAQFDRTKRKKKKKVVIQEPMDDAIDKLAEKTGDLSVAEGIEQPIFVGMKKKKKKPVETDFLNEENRDPGDDLDGDHIGEDEEGEGIILLSRYPWEGTDWDYKYEESEHVMTFLLAELGTNGSLDGRQRLLVKGGFAPKNFQGILWTYINEYVICNGCKSPDTTLSKENRLFFLRCEQCGCSRSVAPIKAGFVVRVGRHKAGT